MARHYRAWGLLIAFVVGYAQGLMSLAAVWQGKACCASTACCATQSCPMRTAAVNNSKDCPMAGMRHGSLSVQACTCSFSSSESTLNLAAHTDWRMDLPRAASLRPQVVSRLIKFDFAADLLKGHTSLPDQPPEFLS